MFNLKLFFSESKKYKNLMIFSLIFIGVISCSNLNDPGTTISGQVADGYLRNGVVFFDCNDNNVWDSGEPKTQSGVGGQYTFNEEVSTNRCSLVVDASDASKVIDEDDVENGNYQTLAAAGRTGFVLSAPKGQTAFVSPFTTLADIYSDDELNNMLASLGLMNKERLYKNYISDKDESAQLRGRILTYLFSYQNAKGTNSVIEDRIKSAWQEFVSDYKDINFSDTNIVRGKIDEIKTKINALPPPLDEGLSDLLKICGEHIVGKPNITVLYNPNRDVSESLDLDDISIEDSRLRTGYYAFQKSKDSLTKLLLVSSDDDIPPLLRGTTVYPVWMTEAEPTTLYATKDIKVKRTPLSTEGTTLSNSYDEGTITAVNCGWYNGKAAFVYKLNELTHDKSAYLTDKTRTAPSLKGLSDLLKTCEENIVGKPSITVLHETNRDVSESLDIGETMIQDERLSTGYYAFRKSSDSLSLTKLLLVPSDDYIPPLLRGTTTHPVWMTDAEPTTLYATKDITVKRTPHLTGGSHTLSNSPDTGTITAVNCGSYDSKAAFVYKLNTLTVGNAAYVTDKTR